MIRGRPVIAIVPARGGSKGIPRKNLYRVGGRTLIERAADLGRGCAFVDRVYISTDDAEMYELASTTGYATPSPRPAKLAADGTRTVEVIRNLAEEGVLPTDSCLLLLQPTSPLRTQADLDAVCRLLEAQWDNADMIVSTSEIDGPHPYKAQIVEHGFLKPLFQRDSAVPRQSLPKTFLANGAFYLGKLDILLQEDTFLPSRTLPFPMSAVQSVNLDGPLDLLLLEAILTKKLVALDDGADSLSPPWSIPGLPS